MADRKHTSGFRQLHAFLHRGATLGAPHTRSGRRRAGAAFLLAVTMAASPVHASAWSGDYLEAVKNFVQEMHLEGHSDAQLLEGALKGMFSSMDPYSSFMNQEETKTYEANLSGQFSGIGATLETAQGGVRIAYIHADSPAEKAGLHDGDILLRANGTSLSGLKPEDAAALIRGTAGTKVTLLYRRGTVESTVTVTRGAIRIASVTWRIDGGNGYVRIAQFSSGMSEELAAALAACRKAGVKKLILDLRDNPGGYVGEAVSAGRLLLPPGTIVSVDYRSERFNDATYTTESPDPGWRIAVLTNENTASAAEILAGAIQDADNGFLIGKKTYGKGVVQSMFMLLTPEAQAKYAGQYQDTFVTDLEWAAYYGVNVQPDEVLGLAKITTGRYLTRNGRALDKEGLLPDAEAENRTAVHEVDISYCEPVQTGATLAVGAYAPAVRQAESILKADGTFAGYPDRTFDAATATAIKTYQGKNGLTVNGQLDAATQAALNRRLAAMRSANDPQYALAVKALGFFR